MTLFISLLKYDKNRREQPNNESEIQKERKASADVGSRPDTHMQTWMNMAHWDLKYVWYVYYASTNTGAESGRKEGEWRKEGKKRETGTVLFLSQKTGAADIGDGVWGVLLEPLVQ